MDRQQSWIGANVDPYLPPSRCYFCKVIPTFSYYEFMPLYRQNQDCGSAIDDFIEDEPVPLSKVKEGQEYDIVLTIFTGMFNLCCPPAAIPFSINIFVNLSNPISCRLMFSSSILTMVIKFGK
ncbi:hypothetical protein OIU85_000273 [Salix viminalis]|uniref:GH3 middle domain-containing protein n=1 Tax=Salix viminalis TaxID=40686 RepID=A0A9Q0ZWL8_SALVM|nr:hypothetical protein OIU85_000273 [Salix viminalis]